MLGYIRMFIAFTAPWKTVPYQDLRNQILQMVNISMFSEPIQSLISQNFRTLACPISFTSRGVFTTQSNIYDGAFLGK